MLPFSIPPYVKASRKRIIKAYVIEAPGLASDQVQGVVIDNKVALEQIHATYSLVLLPLTDDLLISYQEALFYADCFAYEHEIPAIALPRSQIAIEFLLDKRGRRDTRETYFRELTVTMEGVNAIRFGPLGYVEFRYDTSNYPFRTADPVVHLKYTAKYARAEKEVHLYSWALKQIDPLSEYLGYYRVIESASTSNGLDWLKQNLGRLQFAGFGLLPASPGGLTKPRLRRTNLFAVLRRRAIARLRDLMKTMSYGGIAKRLYDNRCAIAHGKSIRRQDFSIDFGDVYLDGFVVKLMARLAVEDKLY